MNTLGYYSCNGQKFYSKIQACIYSTSVGKPIQWVFHQDIFSTYPWWIEPEETLDELYDKRARELREQYDYLILSYSGGADTHNIAEAFLRQNILIDEVITNHVTDLTKSATILDERNTSASNFAAEHQLNTLPRLQYLKERMPHTKFTLLDVSSNVISALKDVGDESWVEDRSDHLTVAQAFRYNYFHFKELKNNLDKGKRVAIITGIDKPKTKIIDSKFFIFFTDTTANITPINDYKGEYDNVNIELFYWSRDCARMLCKQAHVVKKWVETDPKVQQAWHSTDYKTLRLVQERLLRSIVYTTWDNSWFQADKSTFWWHSEFDDWFHKNNQFKQEQVIWQRGLEHLAKAAGDYVTYDYLGRPDNLKQFTQFYYIGNMNNHDRN
jgi:hypothetical protein